MIKNIIFDFDGVILDSIPVKTKAFRMLFNSFSKERIEELIEFHLNNGGMSRYKKIEYFFNNVLNQTVSDKTIKKYATKYSKLTKQELSNKRYLIEDSITWIKEHYKKYNLHIASGADEKDLKYICYQLNITKYFISISGSPADKKEIVKNILEDFNYKIEETVLIGDSINDYEAAKFNKIGFYGYNNKILKDISFYINDFRDLKF